MIDANAVTVRIRNVKLLDRVSLAIQCGERVAIVGPNGAGKSTLLRVLSGDMPCIGSVRLKGNEISSYGSSALANHRAMLSQHVSVSFPFTVEEVIAMGGGDRPKRDIKAQVDATIAELKLERFRHREMPTLSGGEQQRAHLARVLVQLGFGEITAGSGMLLLDEPTSNLDLKFQINLAEIAKRRAKAGTAVIAVLHDLNLAVRFADRIIVLKKGIVVADGDPRTIMTKDMLRQVFGVDAEVRVNDSGPFILPQDMTVQHNVSEDDGMSHVTSAA